MAKKKGIPKGLLKQLAEMDEEPHGGKYRFGDPPPSRNKEVKVVLALQGNKGDVEGVVRALALVSECCIQGCGRKIRDSTSASGRSSTG